MKEVQQYIICFNIIIYQVISFVVQKFYIIINIYLWKTEKGRSSTWHKPVLFHSVPDSRLYNKRTDCFINFPIKNA